jgi:4-amino-4-deoxy-L-arabinose transferase-like glycosyltransferase
MADGPAGPLAAPATTAPRRVGLIAAGVVTFALANALWSAWDQGWTYDEPFHLEWSQRLLETGEGERDSQQRFNSKTPITLVNVLAQKAAAAVGVDSDRALRFAARLPSVGWLALLLAATAACARRWFGPTAGLLALTAAALEPNLVAHASLVTVDVAYALATLLVLAAGLGFAEKPSAGRGALLGLALGLALTAKFSALLLLVGLAPLLLTAGRRWLSGIAAAVAVAWLALCAAYLFRDMAPALGSVAWHSAPFATLARHAPSLHLPLPTAFLSGLDRSLTAERGEWNVLILGRRYPHGVWYYFLLLWLLKTPVALLAAELAGSARARGPAARLLAWNVALALVYFSCFFHAQIGYRFALMAVPLALILAAAGLARTRIAWPAAAAALALAAAENAMYFGNPLAFTNAAVWPKRNVYRLMADSNVDWGQDRERIERRLARADASTSALDPVHIVPGHNTIDLNLLAGLWDFERFRWVRERLTPAGHFGHTYLWYDVDNTAFDEFLAASRRLETGAVDEQLCPESLTLSRIEAAERVPLTLDRNPAPGAGFVLCVENRKPLDLALKVKDGRVEYGPLRSADDCAAELVASGQVSWYRLEAGRHALCARPVPNRRDWLAYSLDAAWQVRGHGAAIAVRPTTLMAPTPPAPEATSPRSSSPPRPPAG